MPLSMYESSIPHLKHLLTSLAAILDKAGGYAADRKFNPDVLADARLFPDMFALAKQVQIATDQAKACAARLAGVALPIFEHQETTLAELQARIAKTIAFLDSVPRERIDGSEDREIVFPVHDIEMRFKGSDYLSVWILPNFYFHLVTAYNILRHNGLDIGKKDYLGVDAALRRTAR